MENAIAKMGLMQRVVAWNANRVTMVQIALHVNPVMESMVTVMMARKVMGTALVKKVIRYPVDVFDVTSDGISIQQQNCVNVRRSIGENPVEVVQSVLHMESAMPVMMATVAAFAITDGRIPIIA